MIRRPPRSTLSSSSAASDVYKRQGEIIVVTGTSRAATIEVENTMKGVTLNIHDDASDTTALFFISLNKSKYICKRGAPFLFWVNAFTLFIMPFTKGATKIITII